VLGAKGMLLKGPKSYSIIRVGSIDNPKISVGKQTPYEFDLIEVRSGDFYIKVESGRLVLVVISWVES
jgi:hypothetical protein